MLRYSLWRLLCVMAAFALHCTATAQLSSVGITIDSIKNKGCFDRFLFFCGKPELTVHVGLRQRDGTIVMCPWSTPSKNLDNVTGPLATCNDARVEAPFDLVVSIADADENKLPAIEIQETGRLSNAPSGDATVPWYLLGGGSVNISGPDADVAMQVSIQEIFPGFGTRALSLSRLSIDPSIGDQVMASTTIVERGTNISYRSGARVHFSAVARSNSAVIDLGEAAFQQQLNITWDGRNGATAMPPGRYVLRTTMVRTGETIESSEFVIAAAVPGLEITRLTDWNSRAGPVEVGYRLTRNGPITATVLGPVPVDGAADPCAGGVPLATNPDRWNSNAGNFAHPVLLVAPSGSFLGDGAYCMRLESNGQQALRRFAVRSGPPLVLNVSPHPVIPALAPGEPVYVEARVFDEKRSARPTGTIAVKASLTDVGMPMPTVTTTCTNVSSCRLGIPPAMVNPSVIALLVFEASASDLANPGNVDPQPPQVTFAPRGVSVGPTLGRAYGAISIPLTPDGAGGFKIYDRRRAIDMAIHPGTGFDLSQPPSRAQFLDAIDATMRLVFGEDAIVRDTSITAAPDAFAFWFTTTRADIGIYADSGDVMCRRDAMTSLPFAEVQAVFHLVDCRDTTDGSGATFSAFARTTRSAATIFWHELHHGAFDLADEYADDGGYFQTADVPNVMGSAADCARLGAQAELCEQIGAREEDACVAKGTKVGDCPIRRVNWWRAAPRPDVMIGNTIENADDQRRANFIVARCRRGQC